ncbi:anti-sigma factor family protein [Rhizobium sp. C4]|uniref:anti-sigma factor family protein n=1 Tax=Rhizobium sp. C4 TaxID=1349800 RepID=UPI001E2D24F5|nr:anti-sigma factor [Rhizobium sp. C4]MCD2173199.1 anti-sigma factor [Rhizobium sp. C4]
MSDALNPVTENDLHAYADGQMAADEQARIEVWLAANPEDAARVAAWRSQNNAIRDMFAPYATTRPGDAARVAAPQPKRLLDRLPMRAAAAIALFALGTATGLALPSLLGSPATATPIFEQASDAYAIYAREVRHPVEVWAGEKDHLVAWLGKRLGEKIVAPDLASAGYTLVGGRLVPVDGVAGALLMYEDQSGKRLTLLLGRTQKKTETAFQFASSGAVETLYWMDNGLAYAVSGEVSREALRTIADQCYRQLQPA